MIDCKSTFTRTIQHPELGEVILTAEVSPCVWMYNTAFQLSIQLPGRGGHITSRVEGLKLADATQAHVDELLGAAHIKPCVCEGCINPAFDPSVCDTNRAGKCESCFIAELNAEWEQEEKEEQARLKKEREKAKAKGYTHVIDLVVHPRNGDDKFVSYYVKDATPEMAIGLLKKNRSVVLDSYRIEQL
ncbi:hypothetical protein E6B08_17460 [Pseudomonas putida]|uniref:Uncharacterized protein n=1 Tax=Pseudomonas putida TaxID=303 RepID=A0A4D6XEL7_PSEPU|nr:hypothetical protein [Pseudomonas putida]QCI13048.1 hypothetical protein E6B08_17460 [Pseudomonas putida]